MKNVFCVWLVIFAASVILSGCNVIPKSVQYQQEEEKLIGSTDVVNVNVEQIQAILTSLGYNTGNKDGRTGAETREAIKVFQESMGLKSTGYIDKITLTQLEDVRRSNDELELRKNYEINVKRASLGEKGASLSGRSAAAATKDIQTALKKAGFDPGAVDDKMGPKTRQAVKEFQRAKGLAPDGKVGPKTWAELVKYLDKR